MVPTPAQDLEEVRSALVQRRREIISDIKHPGIWTKKYVELKEVQETIDAVDRAVADENKLAKPGYNLEGLS